jgi:UDP-N-acetylglucosamine pyrophosphorylase
MTEDELLRQMEKLKSQNRRIFGFVVLMVFLFALAWAYDHVGVQNRVTAREFMLLSGSGQTVARLRQEGTGACLDLMGHSRTAVVSVCAADNLGSYVSLTNANGEIHAILSAGSKLIESQQDNFPPGLLISESNGQRLLHVTVGPDSKILFGESSGGNTLVVEIPKNGRPTATLK